LYPVAPSSLLSTLLPVLFSQSSAVILCFRSACVCICMLKKILWMRDSRKDCWCLIDTSQTDPHTQYEYGESPYAYG
jgi:hypothetical protein